MKVNNFQSRTDTLKLWIKSQNILCELDFEIDRTNFILQILEGLSNLKSETNDLSILNEIEFFEKKVLQMC